MVTIDGVNIDAATSAGLLVDDSVVEATGIRIGATQLNSRGATGRGVECSGGAQLTLEDAYLTGNHEASLNVTDEGTALSVRRTIIADTRGIDAGTAGRALRTQEGARTVLEQSGSRVAVRLRSMQRVAQLSWSLPMSWSERRRRMTVAMVVGVSVSKQAQSSRRPEYRFRGVLRAVLL